MKIVKQVSLLCLFLPIWIPVQACSNSTKKASSTSTSTSTGTDTKCADLQTPETSLTALYLEGEQSGFFDESKKIMKDIVPQNVDINLDKTSYINRGGARHVNFKFSYKGVPFCEFGSRIHSLIDKTYVDGKFPENIDLPDLLPPQITHNESDMKRILDELKLDEKAENIEEAPCLYWDERSLVSALELNFTVKKYPYYALITKDDVLKVEGRFFDATTVSAQSKIYVKEPTASSNVTLKTFTLSGMSSGLSLCSARFKMNIPSSISLAFSTNSQFFFDTSDAKFKETSLFTNASEQADWFLSLGILSAWPGPKIDLQMDGTNNFANNSSVYLPKTSTAPTTIKIGSGDGVNLQNLYIDNDVVYHELGHHIVYQSMTTTSGESLVLHEGLADYFVFGHTGDPCLGRLICPSGGTLCYSAQCLRTGQFPLNYGDSTLPTQAHKQSQFISSMLWDLGNGNTTNGIQSIGVSTVNKLVLKAVDFLPASAQFVDFISSLMKADKSLNNSANCSKIQSAAYARGLQSKLVAAGVSCSTVN